MKKKSLLKEEQDNLEELERTLGQKVYIQPYQVKDKNDDWCYYRKMNQFVVYLELRGKDVKVYPDCIKNFSRLSTLILINTSIKTIPDSIKALSNLQKFISNKNRKLNTLPIEFGQLTNLKGLYFVGFNEFNLPPSFSPSSPILPNLDILSLINSTFQNNEILEFIFQLKSLKTLSIRSNSFKSPFLESINNLQNLKSLTLEDSDIETLPDSIGDLRRLNHLNLEKNKIKIVPDSIGRLTELRSLNISDNQVEFIPKSIGNLSQLRSLDVSNNKLTEIPDSIGNLCNLNYLSLEQNKIEKIPDSIGNLGNLTNLSLNQNKIKMLPNSIGNLSNLEKLVLEHNSLSTLPESIISLAKLHLIFLKGNKFQHLPEALTKYRPEAELEYIIIEPEYNHLFEKEAFYSWVRECYVPSCF